MKSLALPLLGLVLVGAAPQAAPGPAPAPQPTFETQVELVTVDVAVVDKKGQAVRGLTRDDFVVSENGVAAGAHQLRGGRGARGPEPAGAPQRRAVVSTNVVPDSRRGRNFAVVFDDIHLSPTQALRARGAVAAFLQTGVAEGDLVTLVASAGGAWWTARMPEGRDSLMAILKRLDGRYVPDPSPDRITEFEAMRIEEYQDEAMAWQVKRRFDNYGAVGSEKDSRGVRPADAMTCDPRHDPRGRAHAGPRGPPARQLPQPDHAGGDEARDRVDGRHQGPQVDDPRLPGLRLRRPDEFMKDVTLASRRQNVPIYFIDTRGLQGLPDAFTAAFGRQIEVQDAVAVLADLSREAEGAEALALDTGGFVVKNSNDLSGGISRVSSESRAYYLLGYNPTDLRRDGKFRKIEVKLRPPKAKGLTIRARRGYFAPLEGQVAKSQRAKGDPVIGHALDSPFEIADVPLRVSSFVFDEVALDQMSVQLAVEIDVKGLGFKEEADRSTDALAFLIEAQHRETGEYYRYDQKIEMTLLPGDAAEARAERVPRGPRVHAARGRLPGQGRGPRPQLGPGGLGRARVRGAEGRLAARVDPRPQRHPRAGRGRVAEARAAGEPHVRDRLDAVLPVLGLRRGEGRERLPHAAGDGGVRDPADGRGGLQAQRPDADQPHLGRAPCCG